MTAIAVSVYQQDGATLIANIPHRRGVRFLHELNGDGTGSFEIHLDDTTLAAYPSILSGGNIVKMRPDNVTAPVFGWQLEQVTPAYTTQGERADRFASVSGRGVRTLTASGTLYPEFGLSANSADDRGFSAASAVSGPWYISGDWVTPTGILWTADTTSRQGQPVDWPDTSAYYIWSSSPNSPAAVGRNWFTTTFTVSVAGDVGIFCTADNIFSLSLNGDVVLESDPANLYAWKQMFLYTATLAAGAYTLAARVDNATGTGSNPAGFLATIATLDSDGIPVTVLRRTDTANWKVHSYGPPEPGWHAASILKKAIAESQARSEVQLVPLTIGFTDTLDTSGAAWTDIQSERFPIGTDLLTLLARCVELGIDVDVTPDLVVNAWKRKGTDLSATVRLLPGRDVLANVPTAQYGQLRNSALMRHGTGWVLVEDATSIAAHGRMSTSVTVGGADSDTQATQHAQAYFDETAHPQVTLPFTLSSAGPVVPYVHFQLGDTITCPQLDGTLGSARVMSIECSENDDATLTYEVHAYPEVA